MWWKQCLPKEPQQKYKICAKLGKKDGFINFDEKRNYKGRKKYKNTLEWKELKI